MRVLVIKTSSLGDVVHALPAVTDAQLNRRDLHIDWVVEEAFAEIPAMHPAVERVIPVSIRRWRDNWIENFMELAAFVVDLRKQRYDLIVDGQGLVKSAIIAWLAKGPVAGFDEKSAKESVVSRFYLDRLNISSNHACGRKVEDVVCLFAGLRIKRIITRVWVVVRPAPEKTIVFPSWHHLGVEAMAGRILEATR